jgi:hypothetical protein
MSQFNLFGSDADESTESPEDLAVRICPSPVAQRASGAKHARALRGEISSGSSGACGRLGSSLRTSLLCAAEDMTGLRLHWRQLDTPYGRSWWALSISERPTEDAGFGSWVTPAANEPGLLAERIVDRNGEPPKHLNQRLYDRQTGRMVQDGLTQQVAIVAQWQTPSANLGSAGCSSRSGGRKGELLLTGQVRAQWPTPVANDATGSTHCYSRGDHSKIALKLPGAVKAWPTPRASENENRQTQPTPSQLAGQHGLNLATAAQLWPTPQARDFKDTGPTQGNRKDPNLGTVCHQLAGPPAPENPSTNGKLRGSLHFRWVSQLQGLPADWCELPIETLHGLKAGKTAKP